CDQMVVCARQRRSFVSLFGSAPRSTLFPYTTLFRSGRRAAPVHQVVRDAVVGQDRTVAGEDPAAQRGDALLGQRVLDALERELRSEEHTSELQSRENLVSRLLLAKKNLRTSYYSRPD